jgi:hypothetical protein
MNAICSPPKGFSYDAYVKSTEAVRSLLQKNLGSAINRPPSDNYSMSDTFEIGLDADGRTADVSVSRCIIELFISYRGPLYALRFINCVAERVRIVSVIECFPFDSRRVVSRVAKTMKSLGYERVNDEQFLILIDGFVTELDGLPATLFNVLFSEHY